MGFLMSLRHMLCAFLVVASTTSAMAANDGVPTTESGAQPSASGTTPGAVASPAPNQAGTTTAPGAPACRQAKAKQPLTAEEKARRKALHAQQVAQGSVPVAKPHRAKLPLC